LKPAPHLFFDPARRRFRARLLRWYGLHQRTLPWRQTRDPYRIWVSEIMLQQTRVGAVLVHYREFLRRFPNVGALASARLDQVLAAWSGLGYYRRARALHQAARQIVREHDGRLPRSSGELRGLPGIGRYTAAAVASIAFGEPCAVLDGNVERVLRRVLACRDARPAQLLAIAQELLSRRRPGAFNQAMMELGATVCVPGEPRCSECPVRDLCGTQGAHASLPTACRRYEEVAYALNERGGCVYLARRNKSESLMPGMWELPALATVPLIGPPEPALSGVEGADVGKVEFVLRHAITTTDYRVSVIRLLQENISLSGGRWVRASAAAALPLTGLTRKILRRAGVI
jgi:A/G-specific adenine glycosylase